MNRNNNFLGFSLFLFFIFVILVIFSGCSICSSANPCDSRPSTHKTPELDDRKPQKEGTTYFFYVGGQYPIQSYIIKNGKLVPTT